MAEKTFTIENPILRGFNPDPSICRVGDDFYIACSTFEYWPGVIIYKSKDLVNWEIASRPLVRHSQLDMRGNMPSGGIWAPCLSHSNGKFYLIYTDVKTWYGTSLNDCNGFKDTHNFLVTADEIDGEWSEPIYMNSSGFDPSLFHDDDGKKWFVNMVWDHRNWKKRFGGILLQEYDEDKKMLVGEIKNIFPGSDWGYTEAPHLYKRNGYYYLMTAEGGTLYEHAVTLCRSKNIEGPYELHPQEQMLTSMVDREKFLDSGDNVEEATKYLHEGLQKAGHASFCEWEGDTWALVHLCGRPLPGTFRCPQGRETAIQRVEWKEDNWPYIADGHPETVVEFPVKPGLTHEKVADKEYFNSFDTPELDLSLTFLRTTPDFNFTDKPGWLTLKGAESPLSTFKQALVLKRATEANWECETAVDFSPENFQQFAGLMVRYNESNQYFTAISIEEGKRTLILCCIDQHNISYPCERFELKDGTVYLKAVVKGKELQFFYRQDDGDWIPFGVTLDASTLSDEYVYPYGFTGTFFGLCCFDISGQKKEAHFDYLRYKTN